MQKSQSVLHFELYKQVNENTRFSEILGEPPAIAEKRKTLTQVLKTMNQCLRILERDPEISASTIGDPELEAQLRQEMMNERNR